MTPLTHLRLYVDPRWRRVGIYSPLMNPWWGNPHTGDSLFAKEFFDSYQFDTNYYSLAENSANADMVFAPYRHNWLLQHDPALLEECADIARRAGLPLLIDGVGDVEYPVGIENAYILRIGGYRFIQEPGRIQIPSVTDDLLTHCAGGVLQTRSKRVGKKPVVGFAGWAQLTPLQTLRTILKELPIRFRGLFDSRYRAMTKGVLWRARTIAILKQSSLVELNLKERSSFSGSSKTAEGDLRVLRQELVDVILASDYCLDVRGDANESNRLSEILSLGRIPLIVDTERNLPFADALDYDEFSLRVDFRDVGQLPERVATFHTAIAPERFESMQKRAREVFLSHFRIDALMPHIIRQINVLRAAR